MLNRNGGVAIFCGRKDTADNILKRILEIGKRGIDISSFMQSSNSDECIKITHLIDENYGQKNIYYEASQRGVFAHHRGISCGIRVSIEHAMRHDLIRCIVCTSTLSQGVNLPIKYLIVTTLYQANERIKTRDFHNLIGRAGRAGVYTEGTILLSETFVYSSRQSKKESWRWNNYLEMLDPTNSESYLSQFLILVRPKTFKISYSSSIRRDFFKWAVARYNLEIYEEKVEDAKQSFEKKYPRCYSEFVQSINQLHHCLDAIESYLLSYLSDDNESNLDTLVSATFGYFLADETEKQRMREIFTVIKNYLFDKIETHAKRLAFSRTLLPATHLLEIEKWVIANFDILIACTTISEVLQVILSQIVSYSETKRLKDVITTNEILSIANMWIEGKSYRAILDYSVQSGVQIYHRKKASHILLNDIIEICDDGFGFNSILVINAIAELLQFNYGHCEITCGLLHKLARQMRYGLPTQKSIIIYEAGFGDRVVAQNLASALYNVKINGKEAFKREVKKHYKMLSNILSDYPKLFRDRLLELAEN